MAQNTPVSVVPNNALVNNVFPAIKVQLSLQTGFLKSMQATFTDMFKFDKDEAAIAAAAAAKKLSEKKRKDVSGNDDPKPKIPFIKGFDGLVGGALRGEGADNLFGKTWKDKLKSAVPFLLAPIIGSFIKGAITKVLTDNGMTVETAKVIGATAFSAVSWGMLGKLLFGPLGGLAGLLYGVGSHAGDLMEANKDNIISKVLLGMNDDPEFWNKWGGRVGLAAGALLVLFGKKLSVKLLSIAAIGVKAVLRKINPFAAAAPPVTTPPVTPPGTSPRPPGPGTSPRLPSGTPPTPRPPLPSGTRFNSAGKVIAAVSRTFTSVAAVAEAMKNDPAMATKYAKYAKFFKFAGPAMAVIPALIDPAMAIYNDESDEEIKKQIVGALGSIGGAYLGGLIGGATATAIPGVGQSGIGNLIGAAIGAVGGALSGEYLAEEVADFLMGGDKLKPVDGADNAGPAPSQIGHAGQKAQKVRRATRSQTPGATYNENGTMQASAEDIAFAKGNSARPTAGYTPAIIPGNAMSQKVDMIVTDSLVSKNGGGGGGGVNLNQMGGNVSNNTNVGGASTTFNVFQASGSGALSNSLPVNMAT